MLTPRYNKLSELLEDFQAKLNGMDEVQPTVEAVKRDRPAREPDPIIARTSKGKRIRASGQMEDAQSSEEPEEVEEQDEVEESVSPIHQYKVMAGLVEHEMVPRDPGLWGTTRFNEAYVQEIKAISKTDRQAAGYSAMMGGKSSWPGGKVPKKAKQLVRAGVLPPPHGATDKLQAKTNRKAMLARIAARKAQEDLDVQEGEGSRWSKADRQEKFYQKMAPTATTVKGSRKEAQMMLRRRGVHTGKPTPAFQGISQEVAKMIRKRKT